MMSWVSFFSRFFFVSLFITLIISQPIPSHRRTLVLFNNETLRHTHSNFFRALEDDGQTLTFKVASDASVRLQAYGESSYDSLIIFGSSEELGGANVPSVLSFLEDGKNLLLVTDDQISSDIHEIGEECGVEFDDSNTQVIDHLNFDTSDFDGFHNLIVADQFLDAPIITGELKAPVLYRGIGMSLRTENKLVFSVLNGASSSYSFQTGVNVDREPHVVGQKTVLVASLQARNNARITISGSLDLFSNLFFEAPAQKYSETNNTRYQRSSNQEFVRHLSQWTFKETGLLSVVSASHSKLEGSTGRDYRIKDKVRFSATVREWNGQEWVPFKSNQLQLEFVRLDPYLRLNLKHDDNGVYSVDFIIPDVYGVFTFRLIHNRIGYSFVEWQDTVAVRPYRHDEYERFIVTAYPYYASVFSMMLGFALFSILFLYHDSKK